MSLLLAARRNSFWNTKRFPINPRSPQEQKNLLTARKKTLAVLETTCINNITLEELSKNITTTTTTFQDRYAKRQKNYENSLSIYHNKPSVLNKLSEKQNNLISDYFYQINNYKTCIDESNSLLEQINQVKSGTLPFDQMNIIDKKLGEQYWKHLENERICLYNDQNNPYPGRAIGSSLFIIIACTVGAVATTALLGGPTTMCASFGVIACLVSSMIAYFSYNLICALPHYDIQGSLNYSDNTDQISNTPTITLNFSQTDLTPEQIKNIDITTEDSTNNISISLS